ncbi:hypothetical protein LINPERHAP1_LOCUS29551 [Linum perenne]
MVFLMKIVWGLISRPDDLWANVLITKYLNRGSKGYTLKRQKAYSTVWRGVLNVWQETLNGIQWNIRDGKNTKLWIDIWLDSGVSLIDFAANIQGLDISNSVSDFCLADGSWDFPKLESCLPSDLVM